MSLVLRKVNLWYEWGKKEYKLNRLQFMDDLKLFSKGKERIEALVRTVHYLVQILGYSLDGRNVEFF